MLSLFPLLLLPGVLACISDVLSIPEIHTLGLCLAKLPLYLDRNLYDFSLGMYVATTSLLVITGLMVLETVL